MQNIANDLFCNVQPEWKSILLELYTKHKSELDQVVSRNSEQTFPEQNNIFRAFTLFDRSELRVVIVGQDPYINPGEADGLCFSIGTKTGKIPPSLRNIFREMYRNYGIMRTDPCLLDIAKQGVLLMNTALTVQSGKSGSHSRYWKSFTRDFFKIIGGTSKNVVFILWGAHAQSFEQYIDTTSNLVLKHTHPSPLSRKPFIGNDHFVLTNNYLLEHNKTPIQWTGTGSNGNGK